MGVVSLGVAPLGVHVRGAGAAGSDGVGRGSELSADEGGARDASVGRRGRRGGGLGVGGREEVAHVAAGACQLVCRLEEGGCECGACFK